jgi:hypothetical protein
MFRLLTFRVAAYLLAILAFAPSASGQIAMPDPTQMAGMAIPAPELPDGTVSVRLVREQLGNNIVGHEVTVTAGEATGTGKTDETGRAAITGLPGGATANAHAVVDGEQLTSKPFQVPTTGGIRVILIAGLEGLTARREQEAAEAAKAPPAKGIVVFGGDTRFIFEFQDDSLRVFYLLDIVNTARTRVDTGGPLIIDLPTGAAGTTIMEGSFPGATANGDRVTIAGPFPPGTSSVRIGYGLDYNRSEVTIAQKFPAALERVNVILEQVGDLHMTSPQFTDHGNVKADDGTPFILGNGGALAAGTPLTLQLAGLPSHSTWPRNIALALAIGIGLVGAWLAFGSRSVSQEDLRKLKARRDTLYGELAKIEDQHRNGRIDPGRYHSRRHHLITELERIYGELDNTPGPRKPTGEGSPESDRAA